MLIEGRGTRNLDPLVFFVATDSRLRGTIRSVKATTLTVIASLLALNVTTLSNSEPQHRNDKRPALRSASTVKANVPIGFESNVGQFRSEARYVSRGRGYDLFLTPAEAVFNFKTPHAASDPACVSASVKSAAVPSPRGKRNPLCYSISSEPIRLRIAAGNAQSKPEGRKPLSSYSNYLLGNDPRKWYKHVPHFGEVWYAGVYPGIDLVYYGTDGQLEYDFVVAPDANANQIAFSITGLDGQKLRANANGDLVIPAGDNEVLLRRPRIYQGNSCLHAGPGAIDSESSSCREVAGGRFRFNERDKLEARIRLELPVYDHTQALVVDPIVSFSTYLGGNVTDIASGLALDSEGNIYLTGTTNSTSFPVTAKPIQGALDSASGDRDTFVSKLSADGSSLIYSTYLGGSSTDYAYGIAVDSSGSAYVTGQTLSADFPVVHPYLSKNPNGNAYLSKLSPDGSTLVYSTFFGGTEQGESTAVAVNSNGEAAITGWTLATDLPLMNAFQSAHSADFYDAFVTKFSADGTSLIFSTYLGGNSLDYGQAIATDPSGNIYVGGITGSTNFPTTPGAFEAAYPPGSPPNGFVSKFDPSGTLVYSTYLATAQTYGIAVSATGNAFVTGGASDTLPVTAGAFQTVAVGADTFVTEFDSTGSSLVYSTFLGGDGVTYGNAIAVDSAGNAYVTGETSSPSFPLQDPTQSSLVEDVPAAFVTEFNSSGSQLIFSTYLGGGSGGGDQAGNAIAVDSGGNITVAGATIQPNFPVLNAFQATLNGFENAFITRYAFDFSIQSSPATATVSAGQMATTTINVNPDGGLAQTFSFTCSGAPQNSTCSVSPTSVSINGTNTGSVKLTVATMASSAARSAPDGDTSGRPRQSGFFSAARVDVRWMLSLAGFCCLFVAFHATLGHKKADESVLFVTLILGLLGCGGSSAGSGGGGGGAGSTATPAGTYTITVTATSTGGIKHEAQFTLTVN